MRLILFIWKVIHRLLISGSRELNCAVKELGIETVLLLDYRDSGMTGSPDNKHPQALINAPQEQVAGEIADFIREIKPQVVLTFDPIGGYRHPDHIFIHEVTNQALSLLEILPI